MNNLIHEDLTYQIRGAVFVFCTTMRQKLVFLARFYLARSRCSLKPQSRQVRQTDSLRPLRLRVFARNNLVAALPRWVFRG
jgi:hypothetical protein